MIITALSFCRLLECIDFMLLKCCKRSEVCMSHKFSLMSEAVLIKGHKKTIDSGTHYVAPVSSNEKTISTLWKDILKVPTVGRDDNFFQLGGTSLDLIKISVQLEKILKCSVPVLTLFEYTTVGSLARYLETMAAENHNSEQQTTMAQQNITPYEAQNMSRNKLKNRKKRLAQMR